MARFAANTVNSVVTSSQFEIIRLFKNKNVIPAQYYACAILMAEYLLARYSYKTEEGDYYCDAYIVNKKVPQYKEFAKLVVEFRNKLCHEFGSPSFYALLEEVIDNWSNIRDLFIFLGVLPDTEAAAIFKDFWNNRIANKDDYTGIVDMVEGFARGEMRYNINSLARAIKEQY